MKKVLFATTALVASAGIASAEVASSGSAEMGVRSVNGGDLEFHQSVDIRFTMTGETDNGLTFGATIDLDDAVEMAIRGNDTADVGSNELADFTVFISGSFGTLTMGDTDGALDWAMTDLDQIGDISDANTSHAGFNGNGNADGAHDGQVVRYNYAFGDFSFAVSAEMDDDGVFDPTLGIGGKYSADLGGVTLGVGLGYQSGEVLGSDFDVYGVSVDVAMSNGLRGIVNYSSIDVLGVNIDHIGVGLFYKMDALSVGVNYGEFSSDGVSDNGFGLAANYDLGGGASVRFGYGDNSTCDFGFNCTDRKSVV